MVYISRPKPPEWPLNYVYLNFQVCIMGSFCEFKPPWSGHKRRKRRRIGKAVSASTLLVGRYLLASAAGGGIFLWVSNIFNFNSSGFCEAADILSIVEFIELEQRSIGHRESNLIEVARYQYIRKKKKKILQDFF